MTNVNLTSTEASGFLKTDFDLIKAQLDGLDTGTDLDTLVSANTAKVGITPTQASNITTNNAKVGITPTQAADITTNNAKVTNQTHTGEVTGSTTLTIANNVVDEANLKISNSPVNGYVLTADSAQAGGLRWDLVSAINSLIQDTTPELGGELDCGSHSIGFTIQNYTGAGNTTINWKNSNFAKFTFNNQDETLSFTNPSNPCKLTLLIVQDSSGGHTLTLPSNIKWIGGQEPILSTASNSTDMLHLTFDGSLYYGTVTLNFNLSDYALTILDSITHTTTAEYAAYNSILQLDSTHFILAYDDYTDGGVVKTLNIDSNYEVTEIDSLNHDAVKGSYNSLVKIDATHFALAYASTSCILKTFSVDGSYNITEIDSLTLGTSGNSLECFIIDSTHLLVKLHTDFDGEFYPCTVITCSLDSNYDLTEIDSLVIENDVAGNSGACMLNSTIGVCLYNKDISPGGYTTKISSFEIDTSYQLTLLDTINISLNHDNSITNYASLKTINNSNLLAAITLHDIVTNEKQGYLLSFNLDASYNITETQAFKHETVDCTYNSLTKLDDSHFVLAYEKSSDAVIKTFNLDASYDPTQLNSLTHTISAGSYNALTTINEGQLILAYNSARNGYIKTFECRQNT